MKTAGFAVLAVGAMLTLGACTPDAASTNNVATITDGNDIALADNGVLANDTLAIENESIGADNAALANVQ